MLIQATLREEIAVGREVDMLWCWARLYRVETLHGNFTPEFHILSCVKTQDLFVIYYSGVTLDFV